MWFLAFISANPFQSVQSVSHLLAVANSVYAKRESLRNHKKGGHGSESREVRLTLCFAVQKSKPDIYQEFKGQVLHLAQNGLKRVSRTLSMTIFKPSGPEKIRVVG